jgi:hypothetical protein
MATGVCAKAAAGEERHGSRRRALKRKARGRRVEARRGSRRRALKGKARGRRGEERHGSRRRALKGKPAAGEVRKDAVTSRTSARNGRGSR